MERDLPGDVPFDELLPRIRAIVGNTSREIALRRVCAILHDSVSHYDWVGFYHVDYCAHKHAVFFCFVLDANTLRTTSGSHEA